MGHIVWLSVFDIVITVVQIICYSRRRQSSRSVQAQPYCQSHISPDDCADSHCERHNAALSTYPLLVLSLQYAPFYRGTMDLESYIKPLMRTSLRTHAPLSSPTFSSSTVLASLQPHTTITHPPIYPNKQTKTIIQIYHPPYTPTSNPLPYTTSHFSSSTSIEQASPPPL